MYSEQHGHQNVYIRLRAAANNAVGMGKPRNHQARKMGTKRPKRYHRARRGVKFFNREIQWVMSPHKIFQGCGRKSLR
jgi:hypothetical protein